MATEFVIGAPWDAMRIYELVTGKDFPLPPQQRTLTKRTRQYEKALADLWELAKAQLIAGDMTPAEFVRQMEGIADREYLEAVAEILGIRPDAMSAEQTDMVDRHLAANIGFLQSSLLPDIRAALATGAALAAGEALSALDYRIGKLYGGALWPLGNEAIVRFDGAELRNPEQLFMFTGPLDTSTCTGDRGCDQHVGKVYTAQVIQEQQIIPGTLRCLHNCRHILVPVASATEKHLPGRHDQMTHGSWARRTPEGGKREPKFGIGDGIGPDGKYRVESQDYKSYSGAKHWIKGTAQPDAFQVVKAPDGMYYAVMKPEGAKGAGAEAKGPHSAMSPDFPESITFEQSLVQEARISTHFNNGERATHPKEINVNDEASVAAKIRVEKSLAAATGESNADCREAIRCWAGSSNDTRLPSLAMQEAAEEEFGSKRTDWQKAQTEETIQQRKDWWANNEVRSAWSEISYPFETMRTGAQDWTRDSKPRTRAFLRAQYDATQEALKKAGVTHVVVYRGTGRLRDVNGNEIHATHGDRLSYRGNAIESWSLMRMNPGAGKFGDKIVRAVVPIDRVLSTPQTGFGCLHEYEVVILGGIGAGDVVEVVHS